MQRQQHFCCCPSLFYSAACVRSRLDIPLYVCRAARMWYTAPKGSSGDAPQYAIRADFLSGCVSRCKNAFSSNWTARKNRAARKEVWWNCPYLCSVQRNLRIRLRLLSESQHIVKEYDNTLIRLLIDRINVIDKTTIEIKFKGGFTVKQIMT